MGHFELSAVPALSNLSRRVARQGAVLDVGAYRGMMADEMIRIYPSSPVYLFEPLPNWCPQLKLKYKGVERVTINQLALSDYEGSADFHVGQFEPTSSFFPRNSSGFQYYDPAYEMSETIEVATTTLDAFCDANAIEHVSCLKLDTQGAEYKILRGGSKLLNESAIDIVFTEWFGVAHYEGAPLLDEIWTLLSEHNYTLFDLFPGPRAPNGQLRYGDAIFVSPLVRQEALSTSL